MNENDLEKESREHCLHLEDVQRLLVGTYTVMQFWVFGRFALTHIESLHLMPVKIEGSTPTIHNPSSGQWLV